MPKLPDWWTSLPGTTQSALATLAVAVIWGIAGDWRAAGLFAAMAVFVFVAGKLIRGQ